MNCAEKVLEPTVFFNSDWLKNCDIVPLITTDMLRVPGR